METSACTFIFKQAYSESIKKTGRLITFININFYMHTDK